MMLAKGLDVICVTFQTKKDLRAQELVKHLAKMHKKKIKLYTIPHTPLLKQFASKCEKKATCLFCKRMMLRISSKFAEGNRALAVITGENLGQVASQTLDNLVVLRAASSVPVLSPILGFDKMEIVKIAKEIGTFELSITPGDPCAFAPKYPMTHSMLDEIEAEEKKVDIYKLVEKIVKSAKSAVIK